MQQPAPSAPASLTQRSATAALLLFAWSLPTSIFGMQAGVGAMLLGLAAAFAWRSLRPSRSPLDLAIALLVVAILLSLLLADSAPVPFRSGTSFWVYSAYFLVWFTLQTDTERTLRRAVDGTILLAALACLLGVWQAGSGTYPGTELMHPGMDVSKRLVPISGRPAAIGFFFARLTFAHVMLFAFCWALSLALESGLGKKRLYYLAACPVLAAGIFAAQGRIAWAAALAAALVLCFWYWRKKRLLVAGAAALVLAALAFLPGPAARLRASFTGGRDWTRLVIWQSALELAAQRPVTGVGWGNFQRRARPLFEQKVRELEKPRFPPDVTWAHCNLLSVLAETGLVGLAAFCLIFVLYYRRVWHSLKRAKAPPPWPAAFVRGSAAAVGTFLLCGMFHDNFFDGEVAFTLWFTLAASLAACRLLDNEAFARDRAG